MIESGNKFVSSDFLRVLKALKENIMIELNVADVCQVTSVGVDDSYLCRSLTDLSTVQAVSFGSETINTSDIVLVIFTNGDFRQNIRRIKASLPIQEVETNQRHSKGFGIIIKVLSLA